ARSGLHDAALFAVGRLDDPRESGLRRADVRNGRSQAGSGSGDRQARPRAAPAATRRQPVGRLEAAAVAGCLHAARAAPAAAGRAHRRRRSEGAARLLGRDPPARGRRHHGSRVHALHGRGRALPPPRLSRRRPVARQRDGDRSRGGAAPERLQRERKRLAGLGRATAHRTGREPGDGVRHHAACGRPRRRRAGRHRIADRGGRKVALGAHRARPRRCLHQPDAKRERCAGMKFAAMSWSRWMGIITKEFIQLRRDRLTFGMVVGIPILQLILFGFAINADPKEMPTAVLDADHSAYARSVVQGLRNSGYFRVDHEVATEAQADALIAQGAVQFVVTVPAQFGRALVRGDKPVLLIEADATDPSATGNAIAALQGAVRTSLSHDLVGPLARLYPDADPVDVRVHRRYNPEGVTAYNIVPGLLGTILTMTMILMTGLAMTRERERGTFENLLATPALPIEVMTGKIVPYILIGLVQVTLLLVAALLLFDVPLVGSVLLLCVAVLLFVAANLALGITFSSVARNQLQAMQMTFFFFLPSMLLSGFMFPFRGMPEWAQWLGSVLPLTHFLQLVRGIMLKGNELPMLWPHIWPILAFMLAAIGLGLLVYRRTLD